ncbi:MAG TPA: 30S ribosomal protein S6 [Elusimicrobia bacterium]|nr:30S ribosomal protein S6 [Elusimicrobiota bacterium]
MKAYELMVIINPQVSDAEVNEIVEKTKKIITDEKAEVLAEDRLGRKKFYHQVGKHRDGYYFYLKVKADPSSIKTISRNLKLQQHVLRAMTLKAGLEPAKKA